MKKQKYISRYLLYLLFNLIGCQLLSEAYTNNGAISVVRQMPSFAEPGETITVAITVTIGMGITDHINGFYFTDEIPEELPIQPGTYTTTLNGFDLSNITEEVGMLGDVYPATVPYRLILETPPDFIEGNALQPGDELTISFSITMPIDASEGTVFEFPGFNWVGYIAGDSHECIFGYESMPETTLTIISNLQEETMCDDGNDNDGDGLTDCDDDDCDGEVGSQTTCGVGECAGNTGNLICQDGGQVNTCNPLAGATPEDCFDGLDNDCDGLTDCADDDCDGTVGKPMTCGVGECAGNTGNLICQDGGQVNTCNPLAGATPEDCSDGLDNDCDGLTDCADSACAEPPCDETTVYEDAEDGLTDRWYVYGNTPDGAEITNVFDDDRQSNVIQFSSDFGWDNGYRLTTSAGGNWHNSIQFVIEWSMKYTEYFTVYIDVETTEGHRYLAYIPDDYNGVSNNGEYVIYGLGIGAMDGQWHTIVRDLEADLEGLQSGVTILEVNSFLIRGSGRVDDIKLLNDIPNYSTTYEDAEDGLTGRWYAYGNTSEEAVISNESDADRQSNVIQFSSDFGWDNGYRLTTSAGGNWHNSTQFVIEWSMKYTEYFTVYIDVETTEGHRYLAYIPDDYNGVSNNGEYVIYGLGIGAMDGQWHTIVRDLEADLEGLQPGVTILEVNSFLIRGSGRVDDIKLLNYIPGVN